MSTSRPLFALARQVLSLRRDTDYERTIAEIRSAAELGSGGVWELAFAILIASVGLNVNSTAVIIGAMLISPLMGPIVGAGLALGTDDVPLLRLSVRNLTVSTLIALAASTVYFAISPLAEAQSELLARTRPTLYDVLIALFGGSAGIVAASRKARSSNIVPGVAIATALMPPLCTAGFGLAHGDIGFFLGAMHLFLINALFIGLATLGFVRLLRFARVPTTASGTSPRVHQAIIILTIVMVVPSIYTGWVVVQETRFRSAARRFVAEQLSFRDRSVINVAYRYARPHSTIDATLLGDSLSTAAMDSLTQALERYGLRGTQLTVRQPFASQPTMAQVAALVREGVRSAGDARVDGAMPASSGTAPTRSDSSVVGSMVPTRPVATDSTVQVVTRELVALYPELRALSIGTEVSATDTAAPPTLRALTTWRRVPSTVEQRRIAQWLARRLGVADGEIAVTATK